ncbi:MAG: hypothetical protein ACTHU0_23480 [Kofleriaceae bacterium]
MRDASRYLHSLPALRAIDAINSQLASATSIVGREHYLVALADAKRAVQAGRANASRVVDYTADDLAWFRSPIREGR